MAAAAVSGIRVQRVRPGGHPVLGHGGGLRAGGGAGVYGAAGVRHPLSARLAGQPPRRIEDYENMRCLRTTLHDFTEDPGYTDARLREIGCDLGDKPEYNYFLYDVEAALGVFVFQKYKTSPLYGRQQFEVDPRVYASLMEHMQKHGMLLQAKAPFLLGSKHGTQQQKHLSNYITTAFAKLGVSNTTCTCLRRSYITWWLQNSRSMAGKSDWSEKDRSDMAKRMAHSEAMQLLYKTVSILPDSAPGTPLLPLCAPNLAVSDDQAQDDVGDADELGAPLATAGEHWRRYQLHSAILKFDECADDSHQDELEVRRASKHRLDQAWKAFRRAALLA